MNRFAVEVVRKQTSRLTRTEIHDAVFNALVESNVGSLPILLDEGYPQPVESLEQFSPGIVENVESITIYLENHLVARKDATVTENMGDGDAPMNGIDVPKETFSIYVYELDVEGEEVYGWK